MNERKEPFVMRPGDTFVAEECGCSFTVESGPRDESMVRQAPVCCCGNSMQKESGSVPIDARSSYANATGRLEYSVGPGGSGTSASSALAD